MAVFIGFPLCTPAVDSQSQSLSLTASQQWPESQAISHKDCWDLLVQSVETVVTGFIMYPLSWWVYWICSRSVIRKWQASKQHASRCTHPMAVLSKYLHLALVMFTFWCTSGLCRSLTLWSYCIATGIDYLQLALIGVPLTVRHGLFMTLQLGPYLRISRRGCFVAITGYWYILIWIGWLLTVFLLAMPDLYPA